MSRPDGIYHVTVMPCYDKKLEASRKDFYDEVYSTREVDCVITTGELELLMREKGWDLTSPVTGELDGPRRDGLIPELLQHPGSSSGSYLQSIVDHIQGTSGTGLELSVKMIRNADYEEYTLTEESGKVVFKGAKCYGFRNLQNIVRKVGKERGVRTGSGAAGRLAGRMRRGKGEETKYEYVEVMACPGGCVNGGGQVKRPSRDAEDYERDWAESGVSVDGMPSGKWGDKEWTRKVEEAYWRGAERGAVDVWDVVLEMRTEYRAVESDVIGLAVQW